MTDHHAEAQGSEIVDVVTARVSRLVVTESMETLMAQEFEALERGRRIGGWTRAAALHAQVRERSGEDPICRACSDLVEDYLGDKPYQVSWPCTTATALGIDR